MNKISKYVLSFVFVSLGVILSSCVWIDDIGKSEDHASLELTSFELGLEDGLKGVRRVFPMHFEDSKLIDTGAGVEFRFYEAMSRPLVGDMLAVNFPLFDAESLKECPDVGSMVGDIVPLTSDGCVRASVQCNGCEPGPVTLRILGNMELVRYSLSRGGQTSGIVDGELVYEQRLEQSTGPAIRSVRVGHVSGRFSVTIHAGSVLMR